MTATPLVELGAILLGLAVLARLASRVGISTIPLFLLGGLAIGEGGLVPLVTTEEFADTGAEIGLVLLLFTLGLEYSADELVSTMRSSLPAGGLNFILNFPPGVVAGLVLGWGILPAMFLGGITFVTSSSVAAKIVADLGWRGNRETPIVLSISIMEDLTMALYLPVLGALAVGGQGVGGVALAVVAVGAVGLVLLLAQRLEPVLNRLIFTRSEEAFLLTIMGAVVLAAGIAEQARVSAAVGALLAGIVLSGPAAETARDLLPPLRHLFAAIFFAFIGIEIAPDSIPPMIVPALVLAAVGILTKVATGWWAARAAGLGRRARARAGALLIPRGEFALALAGLAVAAGLETQLASLTVAYVIILVVVGPVASRAAVPIADRLRRGSSSAPSPS